MGAEHGMDGWAADLRLHCILVNDEIDNAADDVERQSHQQLAIRAQRIGGTQ